MEKQVILSNLRNLKVARFEENTKDSILGTLVYQDYTFNVYLLEILYVNTFVLNIL